MKAAVIYSLTAFIISILAGWILHKIGFQKYIRPVEVKGGKTAVIVPGFTAKIRYAFLSALKDYLKMLPYLFAGVAIGAVIYGLVPEDFLQKAAGKDNPFAVPVAAVIGIPLYIRASSALAIVAPLVQKGISVGTAIAFVVGGAGMAIPEMTLLAGLFRKRVVAVIVFIVFITATASGFIFNIIQ